MTTSTSPPTAGNPLIGSHCAAASGGQFGFEGTAALVAASTSMDDEPVIAENMRGWLLADGLVMVKYLSIATTCAAWPAVADSVRF